MISSSTVVTSSKTPHRRLKLCVLTPTPTRYSKTFSYGPIHVNQLSIFKQNVLYIIPANSFSVVMSTNFNSFHDCFVVIFEFQQYFHAELRILKLAKSKAIWFGTKLVFCLLELVSSIVFLKDNHFGCSQFTSNPGSVFRSN